MKGLHKGIDYFSSNRWREGGSRADGPNSRDDLANSQRTSSTVEL